MLQRGLFGAAVVGLAAVVGVVAGTGHGMVGAEVVLLLVCLGVAAAYPVPAALVAAAVAMYPPTQESGPLAYAVLVAAFAGVALRHLDRFRDVRLLIFLAFLGLAATSHFAVADPWQVAPEEARNHLIATLIGATTVLTVALARPSPRALFATLALSGAAASVYILASGEATASGRFATLLLNENTTGHIGALAAVSAFAASKLRRGRWIFLAAPGVLLAFYSQSRGAFVILVVGVTFGWLLRKTPATRVVLGVALPVVAWAAWPAVERAVGLFFDRRGLATAESASRVDVLQLAGELTAEHPVMGIGWRAFPDYSLRELGTSLNTHNEYARIGAEVGLLALVLLAVVLIQAVRSPLVPDGKAALVAGLVAFGLANSMSNLAVAVPVWAMVGLALAQPRREAVVEPVEQPKATQLVRRRR